MRLLLLYMFFPLLLVGQGQGKYDRKMISENGIFMIEGYKVSLENEASESLITRELFNKAGSRTSIELHKESGFQEYEYHYKNDTTRMARVHKVENVVRSKSILKYDEKGRHIRSVDYDRFDQPTGIYETKEYKDEGRLEEYKLYDKRGLKIHSTRKYNEKGEIVEAAFKTGGQQFVKNKNGKDTETFPNYNGSGLKLVRTIENISSYQRRIGAIGLIDLNKGDELITESYINADGLVEYVLQFINSELNAKKRNEYSRLDDAK